MIEKDILPLNEIERLERELRQLKEKYDKLYKENQNLKVDDTRILKDVIERKKFNYLFSYDINETGEIVNGSEYIANTNFTKLYKCLLGTIKPYAKLEKERYFLRIPNFSDLTQTEWTILRVLTEKVLNEMVMAKIMINKADNETLTEDDVRQALENAYDVRTPSTTQNAENKESVVETFQYDEEAIKHEQTVLSYIIINMGNILKEKSAKQLDDFATFIHEPYQRIWCHIKGYIIGEKKITGEVRHIICDSLSQKLQNIWEDTVCKFYFHPAEVMEFESSREWLKKEHLMDLFRKKKHYHRDYEVYHEKG